MFIVFTDLDATLLDHNTYSFEKAENGIKKLKEKNCPLILVSSKTFDEIKDIHRTLALNAPFIFENGAGIAKIDNHSSTGYRTKLNGKSSDYLFDQKEKIQNILGCEIFPLSRMTTKEIVKITGLSEEAANLASIRKASMPFITKNSSNYTLNDLNELNKKLNNYSLKMTKGGRFLHLSSIEATKGNAVQKIMENYKQKLKNENFESVAIGDSENDIPMLEVVDIPYLVRKYDNSSIETGIENINITKNIGPAGFSEMVENLFK